MQGNITSLESFNFDDAVRYHRGDFPPMTLNHEKLLKPFGEARAALAGYNALLQQSQNKDLLLGPLSRQEAVVSSRIEGTIATLDEVLQFEADGDEKSEVYRQEVLEVYSYHRAMRHAQRLIDDGLPICSRLIRETHSKLLFLGRGADKQPGNFKTETNYIVDRTRKKILFIPIEPHELEDGIAKLEKYIHNDEVEPLLQTAISHVEFEALHPFKDGNGRVGRMLITLSLWSKGLIREPHFYVSSEIEARREEYIERLRLVSSNKEWTEWCVFFFEIIAAQAQNNIIVAEKIIALYAEMKETFRQILASQWTNKTLDYIFAKPVFKNSSFTKEAGIPAPTAARFTKLLADRGLLRTWEPASGRRPALFAFEPLLEIVRK